MVSQNLLDAVKETADHPHDPQLPRLIVGKVGSNGCAGRPVLTTAQRDRVIGYLGDKMPDCSYCKLAKYADEIAEIILEP